MGSITPQRIIGIVAIIGVLATSAGGYVYLQATPHNHLCSGVTQKPDGSYTFSWLHVSTDGILRNADNCEVVFTGFDWQGDFGTEQPGGAVTTDTAMQNVMAAWRTDFGVNVYRVYLNPTWYNNTVTNIAPAWNASWPTYDLFFKHVISVANANGAYVVIAPDTTFPDLPTVHSNTSQSQGECNFSGTLNNGCSYVDAAYLNNPSICKDGSVITGTLTAMTDLATYYSSNPGVIFETWNEMGNNQCNHQASNDFDGTGTQTDGQPSAHPEYTDLRTYGSPSPAYDQPYLNTTTAGGVWYDHQTLIGEAVRSKDPNQVLMVTGNGAAANFCGITGCGSPSFPSWSAQSTFHYAMNNLIFDYHAYPPSTGCGGGYMVNSCGTAPNYTYKTNAYNALNANHADGDATVYGEFGGLLDSAPAGSLCIPAMTAKLKHTSLIYYEPRRLASNYPTVPETYTTAALAMQRDFAYVRGDSGALAVAVDQDNSTSCTGY